MITMRRAAAGIGVLLPLCLSAAAGGFSAPGSSPAAPALSVVVSGEQNGYLTPCGCSKPLLGGMPRRGGALRALPGSGEGRALLENGDLTPARGRQDELKAETMVDMLTHLGYDVLNLGEQDLRLGLPYVRSLQQRFRGAVLCGNAKWVGAGAEPPFLAQTVLKRRVNGRDTRVLVVGLLSASFAREVAAACPELTLEEPGETLARLQPSLSGDVRILLYHGPLPEAQSLAQRFPLFQLVVAAHAGDAAAGTPRQLGETLLIGGGEKGKHLTQVGFSAAAWKPSKPRVLVLGPDVPEDATLLQLKSLYLERLSEEKLLEKQPRTPLPEGKYYAGSAACAGCHQSAHATWTRSTHSRALQTLTREKHDRDPECVGCHVVGLERVGGFVDLARTPDLSGVGCESCHGPAGAHVKDPKQRLGVAGAASCGTCHVPEHSPGFDYTRYWARIRH